MKRRSDTDGYNSNCPYYDPCPICYGCRAAYSYCPGRCRTVCEPRARFNMCTSKLHYPKNFEQFIQRPSLDLDNYKEKENGNNQ